MTALFFFTVRQTVFQRKAWVALLLLACPAVLVLLIRHFVPEDSEYWEAYHVTIQFLLCYTITVTV